MFANNTLGLLRIHTIEGEINPYINAQNSTDPKLKQKKSIYLLKNIFLAATLLANIVLSVFTIIELVSLLQIFLIPALGTAFLVSFLSLVSADFRVFFKNALKIIYNQMVNNIRISSIVLGIPVLMLSLRLVGIRIPFLIFKTAAEMSFVQNVISVVMTLSATIAGLYSNVANRFLVRLGLISSYTAIDDKPTRAPKLMQLFGAIVAIIITARTEPLLLLGIASTSIIAGIGVVAMNLMYACLTPFFEFFLGPDDESPKPSESTSEHAQKNTSKVNPEAKPKANAPSAPTLDQTPIAATASGEILEAIEVPTATPIKSEITRNAVPQHKASATTRPLKSTPINAWTQDVEGETIDYAAQERLQKLNTYKYKIGATRTSISYISNGGSRLGIELEILQIEDDIKKIQKFIQNHDLNYSIDSNISRIANQVSNVEARINLLLEEQARAKAARENIERIERARASAEASARSNVTNVSYYPPRNAVVNPVETHVGTTAPLPSIAPTQASAEAPKPNPLANRFVLGFGPF